MLARVAFSTGSIELEHIWLLLEDGGFHPLPVVYTDYVITGADRGYYLEVPAAEAKQAVVFLRRRGLGRYLVDATI